MFISSITGTVNELTPNNQTRFQCTVTFSVPLEELGNIESGRLIATENVFFTAKEKRYTILQIIDAFPAPPDSKAKKATLTMICTAIPLGQELVHLGARKGTEIVPSDTFPAQGGGVEVLDDEMTRTIIHHIAPDSRVTESGHRIDIGSYRSNPNVSVGMDPSSLLRGNGAVISARPRARTTITYNLIAALLQQMEQHVHIVYLDVNNTGTLSLSPLLSQHEHASVLALNDKFVPGSIFNAMRNLPDRSMHKRAVLDFLDMMILPSVLEERRHDFSYAISGWMRANKVAIYRPNEQTIDQFINDIRVDILDGTEEEAEEYITELMNGISETYRGERFNEKNTRDLLDMIEEFSRDARIQSARKTLYDLKAEVTSVFETYSKDIPAAARRSIQDIINQLNDDTRSSLLVVQGQKTTDILRFVGTLAQTLVEERVKRLKIRTPVLFIFNNVDDYVSRNGNGVKEAGSDRFADSIQLLHTNGRRHGLGFCLTAESAFAIDHALGRRIQSYFIGPITFVEEPGRIADLINVSEDLVRPAVRYEDGDFLFTSADSAYHRRVPLPVCTPKNTTVIHAFLDILRDEQERRRIEYQAQEEERKKRYEEERARRREEHPGEPEEALEELDEQTESKPPERDQRRGGRDRRDNDRRDSGRQRDQRDQRQEPRQEPRHDARPEPRQEPRPELRQEPRQDARPEPRRDSRQDARPEPRQDARPEPRQDARPEPRHESRPDPRRESRPDPRREQRPEPRPLPRQEPRPERKPERMPADDYRDVEPAVNGDLFDSAPDVPGGESVESQAAKRSSRGRRGGRGRGKQQRKEQQDEASHEPVRELKYEEFDPNAGVTKQVPEPKRAPAPNPEPAPKRPVVEKPEAPPSKPAAAETTPKQDEDNPKAAAKRAPRRRGGSSRPKGSAAADEGKDA